MPVTKPDSNKDYLARWKIHLSGNTVTRANMGWNAEHCRDDRSQVPPAFHTLSTHQHSQPLDLTAHVSPLLNQSSQHQSN
jgi:hypothetical protein